MSTTLQELNFTVIWLKLSNTEGAKEQIIYGSDFSRQNAVRVTQKRYHRNKGHNYELVVSVTSTLFLRFHKEENVAGRYWCRVLAKDLDDYSFKNEGESTITYIKEKEFYDRNGTFYPPCESDEVLHNTGLQCINRRTPKHDLASTSFRNSVYKDVLDVSMSKLLVVLLVLGGILTVLVVITSLPTANLSKVMCKRTTKRIQQVIHFSCTLFANEHFVRCKLKLQRRKY